VLFRSFSSPVQVGQIFTTQYYSPQQVGSSSWTTVEAASSFSIAIDTNNLLYGWGLNTSGQLGNQSTVSRSSPVQLNANSWVAVAAEFDHVLAIRDDTTLWTWGNSAAIGLVTLPQSWSQISTGYSHTLAIRSDGALFAWGLNTSGQLGQGDIISRSSPTIIGTNSWTAVSAGNNFSLAIDSDNRLYGWGLNTSFQTGDNFNVNKSLPTQIGYTIQDQSTFNNQIRAYGQNIERTIVPFANSVSAFCAPGLTWGIEMPYNANMAVWYDADYTMECWIYPLVLAVSPSNSTPLVLSHGLAWSTSTYWAFGVSAGGTVYFYYFNEFPIYFYY
jgi:alpha-tubulin suppressor-like RCC1 family protein